MIRAQLTKIGGVALMLSLAACGGGSHATGHGDSTTEAAHTENGQVVTSANGTAVTEAAHNYWQDGLTFFQAHEQSGWNADSCSSAERTFLRAADAQGGRFAEALYMAGVTHQRCHEGPEALALFNRALSVNDKFCKARVAVGLDQLSQNQTQQALATFQQAIAGDKTCIEAYVNVAAIQRTSGDNAQVEEALVNLRKALVLDAQFMPAFNEMALLYYQRSATDTQAADLAAIVCVQGIRINNNYAPIYNTMGLVQLRRGDLIEAVRAFEKAIQLDDSMIEAHMNFGQITLGFRGYQDAQRSFARAVELAPTNYDARIGLGAALRGLNQLDQAQAAYEAARGIDANRPEAFYNLAILYQDYKGGGVADLQKAKEFFEQFLAKAGSNSRYATSVTDVQRRCDQSTGHRRRLASAQCRPGRLQNISTAIEAQNAMQQMQRMQAAQAAQQQAAEAANPTPAPAATPEAPAAAPAPAAETPAAPATP